MKNCLESSSIEVNSTEQLVRDFFHRVNRNEQLVEDFFHRVNSNEKLENSSIELTHSTPDLELPQKLPLGALDIRYILCPI